MRKTSLKFFDQDGTEHTLSLPIKDRKRLFALMQNLFAEDNFAYTILGSKPLSWATYRNPLPFVNWESFHNSFSRYHRNLRSGWETWGKYRHLFPLANFWAESKKCRPSWTSILLVNEEAFNTVINNNKKDFQEVLCREVVDGFQLLREARNCSLMNEVLKGHQALMGIVLGYGRTNSWKFLEGIENRDPLGCVWDLINDPRPEGIEIPLESTLTEYNLSVYSCPGFAGDPDSEESLALKKNYLLTKQKVMDYYKNKDFLEATLSLLAGHRPQE